jgi:ribosome-binding factor A
MKKSIFNDVNLRAVRELVGELRPDDGIDPRELARQRRKERREAHPGQGHGVHKQEQLLAQVQMAIEGALQTAATPVLAALTVREVLAQGSSLAVVLTPGELAGTVDLSEAAQAVEHAVPMLRREVAAAITRKDVPNLTFVVLPAGARREDE